MAVPKTVDQYLARTSPPQRAALRKLRSTIKSVAPHAAEAMSYQMPAFKDRGRNLVAYAAFSDHYSLFPMGVSVVEANRAKLAPYLSGKSTIRFSYAEPLPVSIVKLVVRARLAENAARRPRSGGPSTAR